MREATDPESFVSLFDEAVETLRRDELAILVIFAANRPVRDCFLVLELDRSDLAGAGLLLLAAACFPPRLFVLFISWVEFGRIPFLALRFFRRLLSLFRRLPILLPLPFWLLLFVMAFDNIDA